MIGLNSDDNNCKLKILLQPRECIPLRETPCYSDKKKKDFPRVKIVNYNESPGAETFIRCSLATVDDNEVNLHFHELRRNMSNEVHEEFTEVSVKRPLFSATFYRLNIIPHIRRTECLRKYQEKIRKYYPEHSQLSMSEVEARVRSINGTEMRLKFEAYTKNENNEKIFICDPVYSHNIKVGTISISTKDPLIPKSTKQNTIPKQIKRKEVTDTGPYSGPNLTEIQGRAPSKRPRHQLDTVDDQRNSSIDLVQETGSCRGCVTNFSPRVPNDIASHCMSRCDKYSGSPVPRKSVIEENQRDNDDQNPPIPGGGEPDGDVFLEQTSGHTSRDNEVLPMSSSKSQDHFEDSSSRSPSPLFPRGCEIEKELFSILDQFEAPFWPRAGYNSNGVTTPCQLLYSFLFLAVISPYNQSIGVLGFCLLMWFSQRVLENIIDKLLHCLFYFAHYVIKKLSLGVIHSKRISSEKKKKLILTIMNLLIRDLGFSGQEFDIVVLLKGNSRDWYLFNQGNGFYRGFLFSIEVSTLKKLLALLRKESHLFENVHPYRLDFKMPKKVKVLLEKLHRYRFFIVGFLICYSLFTCL